jgi:hypothetical protein
MRLLQPKLTEISVTLTGAASYLVGPGGVTVTARPIKVLHVTSTDSQGLEYPCNVLTQAQWDSIPLKSVTGGPPTEVWYEASNTNGRIYVYPKATGYTLKIDCLTNIEVLTLAETLALPDGYESALYLTLVDESSGSFGKTTPPDVLRRAAGAVRAIKRTNSEPILATQDLAVMRQTSNIYRGY